MIEVTLTDPEKLETLQTDGQGRVSLGVKFANREVELVVVSSEELPQEEIAIQHTIGDEPLLDHERKGVRFARTFGVAREHVREGADAATEGEGIDPGTVGPSDVNWSYGYLVDRKNVARFTFDEGNDGARAFSDVLVEEPVDVTEDEDTYDDPAYLFENGNGDSSAVAQDLVRNVERVYGYDPAEEPSNVRVNPDEAPFPVMFRDPEGDTYVAIAPVVPE